MKVVETLRYGSSALSSSSVSICIWLLPIRFEELESRESGKSYCVCIRIRALSGPPSSSFSVTDCGVSIILSIGGGE